MVLNLRALQRRPEAEQEHTDSGISLVGTPEFSIDAITKLPQSQGDYAGGVILQ